MKLFYVLQCQLWSSFKCCTCEVYIGFRGGVCIPLTFFSITQHNPAAVLPRISSGGRRQDQLTVSVMLLDAETQESSLRSGFLSE